MGFQINELTLKNVEEVKESAVHRYVCFLKN